MSTIIISPEGDVTTHESPSTEHVEERPEETFDRLQLQLQEHDYSVETYKDKSSGVLFLRAVPPRKK